MTLKVVPKGLGKKKQGSILTSSENLSMRRVTQLVVEKSRNYFKVDILCAMGRVSSKQTKTNFGSNRNKLKQDLFLVCFGLFCETKNKKFWFVSVFQTYIETTETNKTVS